MRKRPIYICFALLSLLLVTTAFADTQVVQAKTLDVRAEQITSQEALNSLLAANPGTDTIRINPGSSGGVTVQGNLEFPCSVILNNVWLNLGWYGYRQDSWNGGYSATNTQTSAWLTVHGDLTGTMNDISKAYVTVYGNINLSGSSPQQSGIYSATRAYGYTNNGGFAGCGTTRGLYSTGSVTLRNISVEGVLASGDVNLYNVWLYSGFNGTYAEAKTTVAGGVIRGRNLVCNGVGIYYVTVDSLQTLSETNVRFTSANAGGDSRFPTRAAAPIPLVTSGTLTLDSYWGGFFIPSTVSSIKRLSGELAGVYLGTNPENTTCTTDLPVNKFSTDFQLGLPGWTTNAGMIIPESGGWGVTPYRPRQIRRDKSLTVPSQVTNLKVYGDIKFPLTFDTPAFTVDATFTNLTLNQRTLQATPSSTTQRVSKLTADSLTVTSASGVIEEFSAKTFSASGNLHIKNAEITNPCTLNGNFTLESCTTGNLTISGNASITSSTCGSLNISGTAELDGTSFAGATFNNVANLTRCSSSTTMKFEQTARGSVINSGSFQGSPACNGVSYVTVKRGTFTDRGGTSTFIVDVDSESTSATSGSTTVTTVKLSNPPVIIDWGEFPQSNYAPEAGTNYTKSKGFRNTTPRHFIIK